MTRLAFLTREALVNLRRNALVVAGAVLAVFISMSLAFGALAVKEVFRINTLAWQNGTHVMAFFKGADAGGLSVDGQVQLENEIKGWSEVKNVRYVDQAEAYQEFSTLFQDRPEVLSLVDPSTLPPSLRIELNNIDDWRDIQIRLQALPAFQRVTTAGEQIEQLSTLSRVLNIVGLGLALVLGISAVILIANTIRMAIYARRDEVGIMKLVGASNWFIRVPFVLEGVIEGVLGAGLAVLLVWIFAQNLRGLGDSIRLFVFTIPTDFFVRWGVAFVVFGALAGMLGSMVGLSRYLREADGGSRTA